MLLKNFHLLKVSFKWKFICKACMCMSRLFINPSHSGRLFMSFAIIFYTGIMKKNYTFNSGEKCWGINVAVTSYLLFWMCNIFHFSQISLIFLQPLIYDYYFDFYTYHFYTNIFILYKNYTALYLSCFTPLLTVCFIYLTL